MSEIINGVASEYDMDFIQKHPTMYKLDEQLTYQNGFEHGYHQGRKDAESNQIVDDLIELGYPHNFQHERSDLVEYMYAVTDIIRKAYKIKEKKNG